MTLDEDVQKFGAKGAVLNYIHETDPSIPIEPFVLVPIGADWRDYKNPISELGDCLVRSSSSVEDGKRVSFAGLFYTTKFNGEYSVNEVLDSVNDKDVLDYARIHSINNPIQMGLIFQRKSKSDMNWGILRHPHNPQLLFVMGRGKGFFDTTYTDDYIFDEKTGMIQDVHDYTLSDVFTRKWEELPDYLVEPIQTYKKIEKMLEFQTGYTYHMESGTSPFSVYQFRPFRKKENADWSLDEIDFSRKIAPPPSLICFGITPPEGLELILVRALSTREQRKFIDYSARSELSDLPYDKIVKGLMKKWPLSKQERVYAEQVARIPPNISGSVEEEAFDMALSELNKRSNKEETCLFQENMHFYYGKDIDLVFPNAKVWVPEGGHQFLSHKWFRAMQHYDIVLIRSNTYSKTGDKVRVYSDGVKGKVIPI